MPVVLGQSGVVIGNHCDKAVDKSCTSLFSGMGTAKVYIGEYVWEKGEGMSAEVFRGQSETVSESRGFGRKSVDEVRWGSR